MKPGPFTYHDPRTLEELNALLGSVENAKVLAGGQSLMPMLNMRFVLPDHVIDINRIPELTVIRDAGDAIEIGAMVRQRELLASALLRQELPLVIEALQHVGHLQTRSRGTFGGSLCHLDPSAELPAVATALDAVLTVSGPRATRQVPVAEWGLGYMTPNLEPDEILTTIRLPKWPRPHGYAFTEFARRHGDFAIAGVACLLALDAQGRIGRAALALCGVEVTPLRLSAAEALLVGKEPNAEAFKSAAAVAGEVEAMSDAYVNAAYRKRLAKVLVERALASAAARARGEKNV
jgi:carbon-monoxide dehydrogenase medium subunit